MLKNYNVLFLIKYYIKLVFPLAKMAPLAAVWREILPNAVERIDLSTHLDVVAAVVVEVEDSVDLTLDADVDLVGAAQTVAQRLPRVLLHVNIIKFPVKREKSCYKMRAAVFYTEQISRARCFLPPPAPPTRATRSKRQTRSQGGGTLFER